MACRSNFLYTLARFMYRSLLNLAYCLASALLTHDWRSLLMVVGLILLVEALLAITGGLEWLIRRTVFICYPHMYLMHGRVAGAGH